MKSVHRGDVALLAVSLLFTLVMSCSSGGGNDDNNNPPPPNTVSIQSAVNTGGKPPAPVANATCQFIDRTGTTQGQAAANAAGEFLLAVPPQVQGTIRCTPSTANLDQLALVTFASTLGAAAGTTLPPTGQEIVSPQSTLIATLLAQENPADLLARKAELLAQLADPNSDLSIAGSAAAVLYQQLLQAEANVGFDAGSEGSVGDVGEGDGGGGGGGTDSGGVSGDVGDGANFSPIPDAVCEVTAGLDDDTILFTAPLHDLLSKGRVSRPDMQAVADRVNQALAAQADAIAAAFARLFQNGIGQRLRTVAAGEDSPTPGRYFIPVPPRMPAYLRCYPPDKADLVLATYVGGREEGQDLPSQDVTPATTIFSTQIATALLGESATSSEEVVQAKTNWLEDIRTLKVKVQRDAAGNVSGFEIEQPGPVDAETANAQLMAFAATALYTTLLKNNINADFRQVVRKFVQARQVKPVDLIDGTPDLPAEEAREIAAIVNTSTETAEEDLETDRNTALSTARIRVRVRARDTGEKLAGAGVALLSAGGNVQCVNCPQFTDADGEAILKLRRLPTNRAVQVTLRARLDDFKTATLRQRIVALAQVTADVQMVRPGGGPGTGSGGGTE